ALIAHMLLAERSPARGFFSFRPFASFGRISYGVYLFHVPMVFLIVGHPARHIGFPLVVLYFATSIGMGAASWLLVERNALKLKSRFGSMSRMPVRA
ncbi:MAG TPA: hypothetical protein VFA34_12340, partial [Actinomycetota bacterium]|nr:hypothetical protein [Actinomycetota bacterium]